MTPTKLKVLIKAFIIKVLIKALIEASAITYLLYMHRTIYYFM